MKYESDISDPSRSGDACTLNISSFGVAGTSSCLDSGGGEADCIDEGRLERSPKFECIFDSISIFSSFSSSRSFNSRTSASNARTLSSSDSVYPLGNALRLSLSLVLHSNPTFAHWEQQGLMSSQRIFFDRQRSQACAIRLWALVPTLITFIGSIPGMLTMG